MDSAEKPAGSPLASRVAILSIAVIFAGHAWLFRGFFVDDAYISFRYVAQFAAGNGLVYNIGERVEGYSNFLWILLLTPFRLLGVDLLLASKAMGGAFGIATVILTWSWARRLPYPFIAPLFLALTAPFAVWAMGGLETLLFTFLVVASGLVFIGEEERGTGWLSAPLFGLLALARPEGVAIVLVAVAIRGLRLLRAGETPKRDHVLWLAALAVVIAPYFIWRLSYYGDVLPNTVYAKSMGLHLRPLLEGIYYLYGAVQAIGGIFFLAVPLLLALTGPERPVWLGYVTAVVAAYLLMLLLAGGDWMPLQRLFVHVLPFVLLLVHAGLVRLKDLWPAPRYAGLVLAALVAGQCAVLLMASLEQRFVLGIGAGPMLTETRPHVTYLRRNLVPGDTVASGDIGRLAFRLPLEILVLDMFGLTDAHIAHRPIELPSGPFGRGDVFGKWDVDYVLAKSPRYVQVPLQDDGRVGG